MERIICLYAHNVHCSLNDDLSLSSHIYLSINSAKRRQAAQSGQKKLRRNLTPEPLPGFFPASCLPVIRKHSNIILLFATGQNPENYYCFTFLRGLLRQRTPACFSCPDCAAYRHITGIIAINMGITQHITVLCPILHLNASLLQQGQRAKRA